jgi:filamentous hemagglutinin family protein
MKSKCYLLLSAISLCSPTIVVAQVVPDSTVGTRVLPNLLINGVPSHRVDGGEIRGINLFHSFGEFNIDAGKGIYFSNPNAVTNIFSRVTGGKASQINGTLGVLGNASLFFINPSGIVFGNGARLDVKGSFIATTASTVNFANGNTFSAVNSQLPLLTVDVPVGLGFGSGGQVGTIRVDGNGHNMTIATPSVGPLTVGNNFGLRLQAPKTLALIGSNIEANGGVVASSGGRVELAAIAGDVGINQNLDGTIAFDWSKVSNTGNVDLRQQSLIDVSGVNAGAIAVRGNRVSLSDGSVMLVQNRGASKAGNIDVQTDTLELVGATRDTRINSSLISEAMSTGAGADINITAKTVNILKAGALDTRTHNAADGGNININASTIKVSDFIRLGSTSNRISRISAVTTNAGNAGKINLTTDELFLLNSGGLYSFTRGANATGNGGNIDVKAKKIEITGLGIDRDSSIISSSSIGKGNAGEITIVTESLKATQAGAVSSSSFGNGNAGKIDINASDFIQLSGIANPTNISQIRSSVLFVSEETRRALGLPLIPTGKSGDVNITTNRLTISDKAGISVANRGTGDSGQIVVRANNIHLDSKAEITATTVTSNNLQQKDNIVLHVGNLTLNNASTITANNEKGAGGNLRINADIIALFDKSSINANTSEGNGGNVNINANAIVQLGASNITANANGKGNGGNIQILTRGLFSSSDSKITATGTGGVDGLVNIITPDVNQNSALIEQNSRFIDNEKIVASSCLNNRNITQGKFVVTGNGGLLSTPHEDVNIPYTTLEVKEVAMNLRGEKFKKFNNEVTSWKIGEPIVEATQLLKTQDGRVVLSKDDETISIIQCVNSTI